MSKLLFIFERDMPTVSITRDVFSHLEGHQEIKSEFSYLTDVRPSDIDSNDVIILMRPNNVYAWKIAANARKAGHVVVTFCDDDLLNLPATNPTIPWRRKGLIKALANSDVIWSSSRHIAEKYKELTAGKRPAVMDTVVRPSELESIEAVRDHEGVRIVYAAAPSHAELFERFVNPVIPALVKEFGDDISFTFVSVHPQISGVKTEYVSGMPLIEYRRFMKEGKFDVGLAPLYDDEFSKCKYFNKFIEYTTQGIVGLYSKTEPYTLVVSNEENGFLAENNTESWLNTLRKAITDKKMREYCVQNAIRYLATEHSEDACIERLRAELPEITETLGNYQKCGGYGLNKIIYYLYRLLDSIYLVRFYIKSGGVRAVLNRVHRRFADGKAYSRNRIK